TVRLWDVQSGQQLHCLQAGKESGKEFINCVAFSPDGRRALSGSSTTYHREFVGSIRLWDLENGKEVRCFADRGFQLWAVVFCPDGRRPLVGGGEGLVRLWDVESGGELRRFPGHTAGVYGVAISPDGRRALSGSDDGTARLWDVDSGKELRRFKGHGKA